MILTPEIKSEASNSAATSFTFTSYGQTYRFNFTGENLTADYPSNYSFSDDAIQTVISKDAQAINTRLTYDNDSKIATTVSNLYNAVYNLAYDYFTGWFGLIQDWMDSNYPNYQFKWDFTGKSSTYEGHETYGDAYGWRFTGLLGETIDIVLDSQGNLYGSTPIGNVTLSEDITDFGQWSINQHDGDDIWIPQIQTTSFNDLYKPYIEGKTLHFFMYSIGSTTPIEYTIDDFSNIVLGFQGNDQSTNYTFYNFYIIPLVSHSFNLYRNGSLVTSGFNPTTVVYYGRHGSGNDWKTAYPYDFTGNWNINLPVTYHPVYSGNYLRFYNPSELGVYNNNWISGSGDIFLSSLTTSPVVDPVETPIDQPIPFDDIPVDPSDFVEPDEDPDPVPGIDYPEPEPTPVPLPPIPSVVSGNDDLWPDLNDYFETEDNIIDFTFPAVNVEFPDLSILLGNFVNSFSWVSTIITALFNGSDFSILFSVLAFFFIAAAVLGIYKWWK